MTVVVVVPVVAIEVKPIIVLVDSGHQSCSLLIKSKSLLLHISQQGYLMSQLNFMICFSTNAINRHVALAHWHCLTKTSKN